MKKRQKPVLLVTLLILLVGGVIGINMAATAQPGEPHVDDHSETAGLGEARESDKSQVKATAAEMLGSDAPPKGAPVPKPRPGAASLVRQKQEVYKPQPNDSMTSSQWYTDQHSSSKGK